MRSPSQSKCRRRRNLPRPHQRGRYGPYLEDGAVAYVSRTPLREGDVGIFSVNGKVLCRQYDRDDSGTVHLFSLNRRRADGDVTLPAAEAGTLICFGRVLTGNLSNRN